MMRTWKGRRKYESERKLHFDWVFVRRHLSYPQALEVMGLKLMESQLQTLKERLQVDQGGTVAYGGEESQVHYCISPILQADQIMVNKNIKLVLFCDHLKYNVQYRTVNYMFARIQYIMSFILLWIRFWDSDEGILEVDKQIRCATANIQSHFWWSDGLFIKPTGTDFIFYYLKRCVPKHI